MKPALAFTTMMVLGFAAMAEPSQSTNPNANPPSNVVEARFTLDGKQVVTTSANNSVRIWDVATGQPLPVEARISPDGKLVLTTSKDGTAQVWDLPTVKPLAGPITLVGTWQLVSFKYGDATKWLDAPNTQRRIKHITGTHFTWVAYDVASGKVQSMAGGTYMLNEGGAYTESIEYAGEGMTDYLGKKQSFNIRVEGDKLHQSGQLSDGTKVEEVWQRVK
jgi:hypothetical protein